MNTKMNLTLMIAATISIMFILALSVYMKPFTSEPANADNGTQTQSESDPDSSKIQNSNNNSDGSHSLNNNIENNVDAENADVDNSIENNINSGDNNDIDNNVTNDINVSVDVNVTNNIYNNIEANSKDNSNGSDSNNGNGNSNGNNDTTENVWGVDSASLTTEDMLACVRENFGDPNVWGRYLGDNEDVSFGITEDEVDLLHSNDIEILVIWNHFTDATGYDKGESEAEAAIEMARDLAIPEDVALFANVEPIYPINSEFILGWHETIMDSEYSSGIYGIFDPNEELYAAFEAAAEENSDLLDNMYIWTAAPNEGITTEENAPDYNPEYPDEALIGGWQYGIDAETCNIDTNIFDGNVLDVLW